jgi:phage shock protein PspC (stress-responsive transcriptional regulator)
MQDGSTPSERNRGMAKRLYRSRKDSIIAGVAGGIGEYLEIDPVLIRIAFVVSAFAGGFGILIYIIAWIIMPEAPRTTPPEPNPPSQADQPVGATTASPLPSPPTPEPPASPSRNSVVGGLVLISLGAFFLADNFFPGFDIFDYWPLILIAIGAGILYRAARPSA